jgi:hypothetical protein
MDCAEANIGFSLMKTTDSMTMPYIVGPPIRRPHDFYGRSAELARFFEIIGGTQTQSISVRGLRRAGKTSFLQYVTHQEVIARYLPQPERYVMIYTDMSSCRTPSDFYHRVQQRLRQVLIGTQSLNLLQTSSLEPARLYDVELLLGQFPQYRFILLLDEFDQMQVESFGQEFLVELRALTSVWEYDLACVTASYWDLYHLGSQVGLPPTSPFYNIFYPTPLFLPGLQTTAAMSLIQQPAGQTQVQFRPEQVDQLLQMTGTLPFFVQAGAAKWYQRLRRDLALDTQAVQQQLLAEMAPYFEQWWRHFKTAEREALLLMAQQQAHGGIAETAVLPNLLYTLHRFGLVVQERSRLFINGDLFATWIVQESSQYAEEKTAAAKTAAMALTYNPVSLRRALVQHFSLEELRTLCFDLHLDFDELPGTSKSDKTRELVQYWQKRNQLDRLVEAIRYERGAVI